MRVAPEREECGLKLVKGAGGKPGGVGNNVPLSLAERDDEARGNGRDVDHGGEGDLGLRGLSANDQGAGGEDQFLRTEGAGCVECSVHRDAGDGAGETQGEDENEYGDAGGEGPDAGIAIAHDEQQAREDEPHGDEGVLAWAEQFLATDQVEGELFDEEGIDIEQGRDEGWLGGRTVEGGHGVWMLRVERGGASMGAGRFRGKFIQDGWGRPERQKSKGKSQKCASDVACLHRFGASMFGGGDVYARVMLSWVRGRGVGAGSVSARRRVSGSCVW